MKLINRIVFLLIIQQFSVNICIAQKVDSIVNMEIRKALSFNPQANSLRSDVGLADTVFNNLYKNYSGPLREELLMHFLLQDVESFNYRNWLGITYNYINEPENRRVLNRLIIARKPGQKAIEMQLVDTSGKQFTMNDFIGKVVVVETWFIGCPPCEALSKTIKPIADSLTRLRRDIVFISLNAQDSLLEWKGAISERGKFYSPSSQHFKVLNEQDFMDTYRYAGHPHLMIFDKNGKLISSNAPRPHVQNARNRASFMSLIDEALAYIPRQEK
ncbi:MAG: TlpA family protein disulfide reductase [Pseudobacter sp.]|uniref:TlpA family protein disulfide reductase n=1 Tax=Pseudobacter sp. TaxID=2045420 RepID=UPI003F7F1185